ncbi:hypothetical protein D3C80_2212970 [compost metagenome]
MNKSVTGRRVRADGHHTYMCAVLGAIYHLYLAAVGIHPFNTQAGKGSAVRTHVVSQPLAVWRPDVDIG